MFRNILNSFFIFIFLFLLPAGFIFAGFNSIPVLNNITANGNVVSVQSDGANTYIAGGFTLVGRNTGFSVFLDNSSSEIDYNFPKFSGTAVYKIISDRNGGFYVGGNFTKVGTKTTGNLVHILSNGSVNDNFIPILNGDVYDLVLSPDGSTLYAGGSFTTVNGSITRNRLASFSTSDGAVTSFNPNISNNISVLALSSDNSTLYAGGVFTTVNGNVNRNYLASFNTSDGTVTSFDPNLNQWPQVLVLSSDESILYAAGEFTTVNSNVIRNRIASFSTINSIVTNFNPDMNNIVYDLVLSPDGSTLYAGGLFTTVNGNINRNYLASFNTSDSTVTSFDPNMSSKVNEIKLSTDGSTLYAVGGFTTVNGNIARNRLASFNTSDSTVTSFNPNPSMGNNMTEIRTFDFSDSGIYISIDSNMYKGYDMNRIAKINQEGEIDEYFNPNVGSTVQYIQLSPDGSTLYAGGLFTTVNGNITRNRLASFNTSDGTVTSFNPNVGGTVQYIQLSPDGSTLYAGGAFTTVNGNITRNRLASFNTSDGTVTSFNPNMSSTVNSLLLSSDGSTLYAGGAFTTVNGNITRNRLASFNTSDGTVTSFDPNILGTVASLLLKSDNSTLYAGGSFTTVNGNITRNRLASFNTSDGTVTSFNPNMSSTVNSLLLSSDGSTLYAGGAFTTVNGNITRNRLASFNTSDGTVTSFNPNIGNGAVFYMNIIKNKLTIAGGFTIIGDYSEFHRFAQFLDNTPPETYIDIFPNSPIDSFPIFFEFSGSDNVNLSEDLVFECNLNSSNWNSCNSFLEIENLSNGVNVLEVRAVDETGNYDNSPSYFSFNVEVPPVLNEIIQIGDSKTNSPSYVFSSSSLGELVYGGSCSSLTNTGIVGINNIIFNQLSDGFYYNCTLLLIDEYGVESNILNVTPFTIRSASSSSGSYIGSSPYYQNIIANLNTSAGVCLTGELFSSKTGEPCPKTDLSDQVYPSDSSGDAYVFTRLLKISMKGEDVRNLQKALNRLGFIVSETGPGAINKESDFFGIKTKNALIRFQKANPPLDQDGIFGPLSQKVLNQKLAN